MNTFKTGDLVQGRHDGICKLIVAVDRDCVYAMHPFSGVIDCRHCCYYYLINSPNQFNLSDEIEFRPGIYPDVPKEYIHLGDKKHRTFYEVLKEIGSKKEKALFEIDDKLILAFSPDVKLFVTQIVDKDRICVRIHVNGKWTKSAILSTNNFRLKATVETPFVDLASELAVYGGFPVRYRDLKFESELLLSTTDGLKAVQDKVLNTNPLNLLPLEDCTKLTNHARYIQDKITKLVDDTNFDYVRPFYTGASKRQNIFARKLEGIKNAIRRYFA